MAARDPGRSRVRVKVCGVTTPEDARMAAFAGADALGLNFHPASPRALRPTAAARIVAALPPFVQAVGLFVDPAPDQVEAALAETRLDCLQFHGDEPPALCRRFGLPYVKAVGVSAALDFDAFAARYADAHGLLLDASDGARHGGTGRTFDWSLWPRSERPLILAGGLTPDNVAAAVTATRPYAVDVASGVEGEAAGRKDPARLARFLRAVADA